MGRLARRDAVAPALVVGLAACFFLWQLGSSSLFVDEALSLNLARGDLGHLVSGVRTIETNPPTYDLILKAWLTLVGSASDWVARLPSGLAAVGVVFVIWRIGLLVAGRRAALVAGLLGATSPLLLEYAQQARAYALLALMSATAVMCALEAKRRASRAWLVASCAAGVAAESLHYTALLTVVPLAAWIVSRSDFGVRAKAAFCAVQALAFAVWIPLMVEQFRAHPDGGLGRYGRLSGSHLVRVVAGPFDTRYADGVGVEQVVGAIVVLVSGGVVLNGLRSDDRRGAGVILGLAMIGPLCLLVAAILGKDDLVTRYAVGVAPFMVVTVGIAIARARAATGVILLLATLSAAMVGTVRSHRPDGFFDDTREAVQRVARDVRPGDVIVQAPNFGVSYTFAYYARHRLPGSVPIVAPGDGETARAVREHRRLWIVAVDPKSNGLPPPLPPGYEPIRFARLPGIETLDLTLARPLPRSG